MKASKSLLIAVFSLIIATGFSPNSLIHFWDKEVSKAPINSSKQSFCLRQNGHISGKNIDLVIKPASVTKLYTSLWSLETLGKNHRFKTKFAIKGKDLYIIGGFDPYFVTENLFLALNKLKESGFTEFNNVYFDKNLSLNWSKDKNKTKTRLNKLLNTSSWSSAQRDVVLDMNNFYKRRSLPTRINLKNIKSNNTSYMSSIDIDADFEITLESSPIKMHLKQVNMYSNNFYTDSIFDYLGGEIAFNKYIHEKLNTDENEIYFYTGSGLGKNYTTCRLTILMLEELDSELISQNLLKQEIMAVPGSDAGTMSKRFTQSQYNKKIVAKTGTLNDTSAFSGYIFTASNIPFAVFNHTKPHANKTVVRKLQDNIIKKVIDLNQTSQTISYLSPDYMSIEDNKIYLSK